jgi:hypothetical protein
MLARRKKKQILVSRRCPHEKWKPSRPADSLCDSSFKNLMSLGGGCEKKTSQETRWGKQDQRTRDFEFLSTPIKHCSNYGIKLKVQQRNCSNSRKKRTALGQIQESGGRVP